MSEIHEDIKQVLKNNNLDWEKNVSLCKEIKNLIQEYSKPEKSVQVLKGNIFTKEIMAKGCTCPVCNQNVKLQKYSISAETAKCLLTLYKLNKKYPEKKWFHVAKDIKISITVSGSFAKMRYWGLIEQQEKSENVTHKKTSGMWCITDKGIDFVLMKIKISKFIKTYNQKFYGFAEVKSEKDKDVSISDTLSTKFNYQDLLKNYE